MLGGATIGDRYVILRSLKSGGMGSVYLARDEKLKSIVALKKMNVSSDDPAEIQYAMKRFEEEARLLANLHHARLPKVIDYFTANDPSTDKVAHFIAMSYIEGNDIESIMKERAYRPLPVDTAIEVTKQLLDILRYLHGHRVVYRDLSPRNIIMHNGEVSLVDFGIARIAPQKAGTAIGTPGYAAPEQYKGTADLRSDIYALGAVMHFILTGINPEDANERLFSFQPPRNLNREVPEYLSDMIISMLDVIPENRPCSVEQIMRMLDTCSVPKPSVKTTERTCPVKEPSRYITFFDCALSVLSIAVLLLSIVFAVRVGYTHLKPPGVASERTAVRAPAETYASSSRTLLSPDGKYKAATVGYGADVHYQMTDISSGKVAFSTYGRYSSANDVKGGAFSPDSKKFAAVYHYDSYTWIGVWDLSSGAFLNAKMIAGWTYNITGIFDQ
jgi:serine/threonine protein kinase